MRWMRREGKGEVLVTSSSCQAMRGQLLIEGLQLVLTYFVRVSAAGCMHFMILRHDLTGTFPKLLARLRDPMYNHTPMSRL